MRNSSDQQSPHAFGIDESGAQGADRLTPAGISDVPTDDALKNAGVLKTGSNTEGMTPDSLAPVTRAALDTGFEQSAFPDEGGAVDPRSYPVSDFMRPEAARKGERTGGF